MNQWNSEVNKNIPFLIIGMFYFAHIIVQGKIYQLNFEKENLQKIINSLETSSNYLYTI